MISCAVFYHTLAYIIVLNYASPLHFPFTAKPSDLLAELQGRLPIRVNLQGLTEDDMFRIVTEPVTNLIRQQIALIKSEDVTLTFTEPAIREIARVAFLVSFVQLNLVLFFQLSCFCLRLLCNPPTRAQ